MSARLRSLPWFLPPPLRLAEGLQWRGPIEVHGFVPDWVKPVVGFQWGEDADGERWVRTLYWNPPERSLLADLDQARQEMERAGVDVDVAALLRELEED